VINRNLAGLESCLGGWSVNVVRTVAICLNQVRDPDRLDVARDIIEPRPVLPATSGPVTGSPCPLSTAVGSLEESDGDLVVVRIGADESRGLHRAESRDVVAGTIAVELELLAGASVLFLRPELGPGGLGGSSHSEGGSSGNERELHFQRTDWSDWMVVWMVVDERGMKVEDGLFIPFPLPTNLLAK